MQLENNKTILHTVFYSGDTQIIRKFLNKVIELKLTTEDIKEFFEKSNHAHKTPLTILLKKPAAFKTFLEAVYKTGNAELLKAVYDAKGWAAEGKGPTLVQSIEAMEDGELKKELLDTVNTMAKQKGSEITNYLSSYQGIKVLEDELTKLANLESDYLSADKRAQEFTNNNKLKKLQKIVAKGEKKLVNLEIQHAKSKKKDALKGMIKKQKEENDKASNDYLNENKQFNELNKAKATALVNKEKQVKAISDRKSYFVIIKFLQNMDDVDWFITNVEIKLGYAPYKTSKNWISENISNNSIVGNDGYVSTDIVKYTALVAGAFYSVYAVCTGDMLLVNTALSNKYVNNEVDKQLVNLSNFVKPYIGDQNINKVKEIYDNTPKLIPDNSFKTLGEDQIQGVMAYGSNNIIAVLSSMAVCMPSSSKKSCFVAQHASMYLSSFMPDSVQTITKVGFSVMNFGSTVTSDISYGLKYFAGALDVLNIVHTPYNYFYPSVEVETENM